MQGRVTSFYSSELQKHTSFRAHPSGDGPVRQMLFHDKGVIALGTKSVHMASRRGLPLWHIVYGFMIPTYCERIANIGYEAMTI